MGCRFSKRNACLVKDDDELVANTENEGRDLSSSSTFRVYSLEQIRIATSNFAVENQVVEWYERSGILYNGTLEEDQRQVSVLRLGSCEWPTAQEFLKDVRAVSRLRDHQLVKLLGCCNEGHERLLISEFSPNGTLAKHLFDHSGTTQPLKWAMRLRVALFVAQALEYCTSKQSIYYDLNPDNIFFDEDCNPRLSSFGLMTFPQVCRLVRFSSVAYQAPEFSMGEFGPAAAVYSFGYLLLVLLSGKQIEPSQAFDLIRKGQVQMLIDSRILDDQLSSSDVSEVAGLAALCLQYNKKDRPKLNTVVSFLIPIQKEQEVPSSVLMGLQHGGRKDMLLSPLGEACSKKDLITMHEMFVNLGYKDDDGTSTELSFQMWTNQMQDTIKSKQMGDVAFRNKDFKAAINNYTKFIEAAIMLSPTILARRSLSYLMSDLPHEARKDAIRAQEMFPTWHVASYLQAAAFFALGKENEGQIALRKASLLEKKDAAS